MDTYVDTATVRDPAKLADPQLVARFLLAGALDDSSPVRSDEKQLGSSASANATSVSPTKLSLDPSIQIGDVRLWAGLNANIITEQVNSSKTTTYAETLPNAQRPELPQPAGPHGQYVVHHRLASTFAPIPRTERPRRAPS